MYFHKRITLLLGLLSIYGVALVIQAELLLNWDVSWLMDVSHRLLVGGTYTANFFEINPPMILYLYLIPVILKYSIALNAVTALRLFVIVLASISLLSSYLLGQYIFGKKEILRNFFILLLAIIYLILPVYEFGQREHLLIMLTMPYFFLVACRLYQHSINRINAVGIGLLAGLGFALKPFFILPFIFTECYAVFYTKNIMAWRRPETITIMTVLFGYTISVFILQPDYLSAILPLIIRVHYAGYRLPLYDILLYRPVLYCLAVLLFIALYYKKNHSQPFIGVLLMGFLGFFLAFFIQRTPWFYHILPAYSLAILLFFLLFSHFLLQNQPKGYDFIFLSMLLGMIFYFPISYTYYLYELSVDYAEKYTKLIAFMKTTMPKKSVYFFSTIASSAYPAVDYANTVSASRMAYLGWIPGMLLQTVFSKPNAQQIADRDYLSNTIIDDLNKNKPDFIFVDVRTVKPYLGNYQFDYISYLNQYPAFRHVWKKYHYFTTIEDKTIFKYQVFQRYAS